MVRQYMLTLSERFPPGHGFSITGFAGRASAVQARRLPSASIKVLVQAEDALLKIESTTTDLVRIYTLRNPSADKVMAARTQLFSNFGKLILKVRAALCQAVQKRRR